MFGYIKPYKPELKLKEIYKYSNAYCALCDRLKRDYGFIARFVLSYDATFLLLCLNNFCENGYHKIKIRCPYNFMRVKNIDLSTEALEYAAFINYWLVTEKLSDDYKDNNSIFKFILRKLLISKRKFKYEKIKYDKIVENLSSLLQEIYKCENSISDSFEFDNLTNKFGVFFSEVFQSSSLINNDINKYIKKLFFQLGKWIYIIDAYDDFQDDLKKKGSICCLLLI